MPINPDAVGQESDPFSTSWTSKDALLYAVGIGAGTGELAFTTENTAGVDQQVFPTFAVVLGWGQGSAMRGIGSFNPAMLVHGEQRVTLHKPIPADGVGHAHGQARRHLRQGQGGRRGQRDDGHRRQRRLAALHAVLVGVHPGRGRLGRRPRSLGRPQRAARAGARPHGHLPDVARSGARLPAVGRPQPAALRPGVRGDGRLRPPDPPWPVHLRLHRPGAAPHALRLGSGPVPARRGPVLVAGAAGRRPHDHACGSTGDGEAVFTTAKQDGTVVIDQGALRFTA